MLPPNCLIARKGGRRIQKLSVKPDSSKPFWQLGYQVATFFAPLAITAKMSS